MSPTGVIILREVRSYARQRRTMVVLVLLSAALANAGHAIVAVSPLVRLALVTRHAAAVNLSGHRALARSALVWIGLLPVLFSAQQAAITLAAERERRSLTALLVAPTTIGSILLGKLVGSLAPGLLMLGVAYAVYLPSIAQAAPDAASWLPLPLVLAVLFLLLALSTLMNSIALIISALAPNVAGASITATFVLLPVSFAVATLSVKVGDIGPGGILAIALGTAVAAILVLATASRCLQRAHLLAVLLADLAHAELATHATLGPLAVQDVEHLLYALLAATAPASRSWTWRCCCRAWPGRTSSSALRHRPPRWQSGVSAAHGRRGTASRWWMPCGCRAWWRAGGALGRGYAGPGGGPGAGTQHALSLRRGPPPGGVRPDARAEGRAGPGPRAAGGALAVFRRPGARVDAERVE